VKPDADRWDLLCSECLGDGCRECKKGFIQQRGRPGDLVTGEGMDLFEAYQWLKNYSQFPAPGGYLQQSAAFVDAVRWCDSVHVGYMRARDRKNQDVEKLQANLKKMMGK
jgi:hypothetical protein